MKKIMAKYSVPILNKNGKMHSTIYIWIVTMQQICRNFSPTKMERDIKYIILQISQRGQDTQNTQRRRK